ncbi:hypothetical protein [Ferribacterium limneticum]|uniref:hypothetical protein n=1 Tax=Ferribacterium limneticum TaxID=76259 RepID=UPI001CFB52DA|nr:hypothetical protein [Ferribacterium limneticum]UCV27559.1 hypothetical protein KI617_14960 [Ferribacterium limneticum]UCV31476.1 hypothetical protein KI608_14960 [Ferribacterium limneticum]
METVRPLPEYVDKAKALPAEVRDRLLAKSQSRFSKTGGYFMLQPVEKVALQLHFEEHALIEWQDRVLAMRSASVN